MQINIQTLICRYSVLLLVIVQPCLALEGDTNQPMIFKADHVTLDDKSGNHIYSGNVSMAQGSILIKAERLELFNPEDQQGHFIATGNPNSSTEKRAIFQQTTDENTPIKASAEKIEYYEKKSQLTLSGNAELWRDRDLFKGHEIDYNTEYHRLIAGKPQITTSSTAASSEDQERVHVIIYPKTSPGNQGSMPPLKQTEPDLVEPNNQTTSKTVDRPNAPAVTAQPSPTELQEIKQYLHEIKKQLELQSPQTEQTPKDSANTANSGKLP